MASGKEDTLSGQSRRDVLKRAGGFVLPTLVTFHFTALKVAASGMAALQDEPENAFILNGNQCDF